MAKILKSELVVTSRFTPEGGVVTVENGGHHIGVADGTEMTTEEFNAVKKPVGQTYHVNPAPGWREQIND